jgi:hypothetical protein
MHAMAMKHDPVLPVAKQMTALNTGSTVQVSLRLPGNSVSKSFPNQIEQIVDDQIWLRWPSNQGMRLPLHNSDRIVLLFIQDTVFILECSVVGHFLNPGLQPERGRIRVCLQCAAERRQSIFDRIRASRAAG